MPAPILSRRAALLGLTALTATACGTASELPAGTPALPLSDEAIRTLLRERIDVQRQSLGMAIGVVDAAGQRTLAHGVLAADDRRPVDADTVFPIASISKVFAALLLADAVTRGKMALEDPISKHLPGRAFPERDGRQITLLDLATHTAGLPSYPFDYPSETEPAARAAYGKEQFYAALAKQPLASTPGTRHAYGNIGAQLVADALSHRMGMEFETLLKERITGPLGMDSTAFTPTAAMRTRLAGQHDLRLAKIADWPEPSMPAARDAHSTSADMLRLVAAFCGQAKSPLRKAMALMSSTRRPTDTPYTEQAVGVIAFQLGASEAIGHGGNLPGAAAYILWRPSGPGVVVLSNAVTPVDDVARHLLDPRSKLSAPMKTADIDAASMRRFVGRYKERSLGVIFSVTLENNELVFEPVGQAPKIAMTAQGPDTFVIPRLGARVQFRAEDVVAVSMAGREYLADQIRE